MARIKVLLIVAIMVFAAPQVRAAEYDRILVPIYLMYDRPGAFGSLWRTELQIRNTGDAPVALFQSKCTYFCTCAIVIECQPGQPLAPNTAFSGTLIQQDVRPNDGILIYADHASSDAIAMSLRVRDISKSATNAGTEIPMARPGDIRSGKTTLLNVPLNIASRADLRVYGLSSETGNGDVRIVIIDDDTDARLVDIVATITPPDHLSTLPASTTDDPPAYPGFLKLAALRERFNGNLSSVSHARIEISPVVLGLRYWTFVSVTDNQSQLVTLITPQ